MNRSKMHVQRTHSVSLKMCVCVCVCNIIIRDDYCFFHMYNSVQVSRVSVCVVSKCMSCAQE